MISHRDKGILQIDYNFLNLPKYIKFDNFITTRAGKIYVNTAYTYRADGVKVGKQYSYKNSSNITHLFNERTDYLDGFQYTNELLKFVPTSEGYYNFENNKYIYNYTDHLGNIRLSYFNNGSGAEVLEENNYYPFGMKHEAYNVLPGNPVYKYSYNGKELQTESGLYDYGARFYMADIGRWGVVDPLAEKYRRFSPYIYTVDNPIRFIDPDGRDIFPVNNPIYILAVLNTIANTAKGKDMISRYINNSNNHLFFQTANKINGVPSSVFSLTSNVFVKKNTVITKDNVERLVKNQAKRDGVKLNDQALNNQKERLLMFEGTELRSGNNSLIVVNTEKVKEETKNDPYKGDHNKDNFVYENFFHEPEAHANDDGPNSSEEHINLSGTKSGTYDPAKSKGTLLDVFLNELDMIQNQTQDTLLKLTNQNKQIINNEEKKNN